MSLSFSLATAEVDHKSALVSLIRFPNNPDAYEGERFKWFCLDTNYEGLLHGIPMPDYKPQCICNAQQYLGNGKLIDEELIEHVLRLLTTSEQQYYVTNEGLGEFLHAGIGNYLVCLG